MYFSFLFKVVLKISAINKKEHWNCKQKGNNAKEDFGAFYTVEEKDQETKNSDEKYDDDSTTSSSSSSSDEEPSRSNSNQQKENQPEAEMEDPASRIAYLTALSRGELDLCPRSCRS